jgi:hypothetical protein
MTTLFSQNLTRWAGERINGVRLPANAATAWSDAELAAIGLYRAYPPVEIPEGKQPSASVEWDGQGVRYVLEDAPRRRVLKAIVEQRLIEAGLMDAAYIALSSSGAMFARWYSRISDSVFFDDPDALALLTAIGANAEEIMAP